MIFLPDRTLMQDSCFETFRLSKWGAAGNLIRWQEDTLPVEAEITGRRVPAERGLQDRVEVGERAGLRGCAVEAAVIELNPTPR